MPRVFGREAGAVRASPPFRWRNSIVQVQRLRLRRNCFDFEAFCTLGAELPGRRSSAQLEIIVSHLHRRSLCAARSSVCRTLFAGFDSPLESRLGTRRKRRQMNFIALFYYSCSSPPPPSSRRRLSQKCSRFIRSIQQAHSHRPAARRRFCDCDADYSNSCNRKGSARQGKERYRKGKHFSLKI